MFEPAPCECPVAGYCERHRRKKHARHWQLCQGINCTPGQSKRRRELWDKEAGAISVLSQQPQSSPVATEEKKAPEWTVTVAVICHNYGRFLKECIESIQSQTKLPAELFVVNDDSTDETVAVCEEMQVKCLTVNSHQVHENRRFAFENSSSQVICFIDADDILPETYIEEGIKHFDDPSVAIVYSDMERFGRISYTTNYPKSATFRTIERDNVIHSGSLVRSDILEITNALGNPMPLTSSHADWMTWKRILRNGWKAEKQASVYRYRQHGQNMHPTQKENPYYLKANLHECPVTLFVPLSGRHQHWPDMAKIIAEIVKCDNKMSVIVADTSKNSDFSKTVRESLHEMNLDDCRYVSMEVGTPGRADEDRSNPDICQDVNRGCARIYTWLQKNITTEFALILEDDVFPYEPQSLVKRLLDGFDTKTSAVSGVYRNRLSPERYVAWREKGGMIHLGMEGSGYESIHGNGFGCLMIRSSDLKSTPITCRVLPSEENDIAYDISFFERLHESTENGVKIAWDVLCRHDTLECEKPNKPVAKEDWPIPAKLIATLATMEDVGVGDTIKRTFGKAGKLYQAAVKLLTGSSCKSCGFRQAKWNQLYPYDHGQLQHD